MNHQGNDRSGISDEGRKKIADAIEQYESQKSIRVPRDVPSSELGNYR